MHKNFESLLMEQYPELYLNIKRKSICELKLPIDISTSMVGFGKVLDFYMFWISKKRRTVYFNARKKFACSFTYNLVRIEFNEQNQDAIFQAIDEIYNSYLQACTNGIFEQEIQKMKRKADISVAIASKKEKASALLRLWNDAVALTFEGAEKSCHDDTHMDTDALAKLQIQGGRLAELFEEILCMMENQLYKSLSRKISAYREYIETDKITLADIAPAYQVSRERVRQLVNAVNKSVFRNFKRAMLLENAEFNQRVEELLSILESADYNMAHLLAYGLTEISDRKKKEILNMLFGNSMSKMIFEKSQALTKSIQEQNKLLQKEKDLLEAWNIYQSKICYPSESAADQSIPVSSYENELRYAFEKTFYAKLKKFESIIEMIEAPDIVYYYSNETDHRPHFLLRLPDGRSVLVLVLRTINMAYIYNIKRCNALHRFCRENGYGYLIIDDRGNSIYDIKNRTVDPFLTERFDTLLKNQGMIVWNNIKEIKLTHPVSNADIAAYVLQNRLHFTMNPFCIRHR